MTRQRSALAAELRQASKEYGPDPQLNSRLADIVTKAKKLGFPKASIDNAIARGQGVSPSGATLDTVTIEAMLPSSVAVIVECQTDSKLRTLADIRQILKDNGGIATPTSHLFERKGKVVLEKTSSAGETEVFDRAVEAGAVDVDHDEEGNIVITTEPNETSAVGNALAQSLGNKVRSSEVIWKPKEEVMVNLTSSESLNNFLGKRNLSPQIGSVLMGGIIQITSMETQVSRMCIRTVDPSLHNDSAYRHYS